MKRVLMNSRLLWHVGRISHDVMFLTGMIGVVAAMVWGITGIQKAGLTGLACVGVMLVAFMVGCIADELYDDSIYYRR